MEGSQKKTVGWGKDVDGRSFRLVQIKGVQRGYLLRRVLALKLFEGVQYTQFDHEKGPLKIRGQSTVQQQE
jgi:hypothetical protein